MTEHGHIEGVHQEPTDFFHKYVWSYDHKMISKQYLFTAFFFLILGGLLAMMIRWQLAYPGQPVPVLGPLLHGHFFFDDGGSVSPEGYLQQMAELTPSVFPLGLR